MSGPYCNRRVRVVGTQKEELNGQEGLATTFDSASGRYHVQLSGQRTVALKPVNLEPLPGDATPPAGPTAGFPGMPDMNSPQMQEAQRQVQEMMGKFLQALPPGTNPQTAATVCLVSTLYLLFTLGIFRGVLVIGLFGMLAYLGLPAFTRNGGGQAGMAAASDAVGDYITVQISQRTGRQVPRSAGKGIGAVIALMAMTLVISGTLNLFGFGMGPSATIPTPRQSSFQQASSLAEAYKRGYDAGVNGEVFSNPFSEEDYAYEESDYSFQPASAPASSSGFDMTKLIPLLLVGRTVYALGKPGAEPWDQQRAMANFQLEPLWKKAIMAFALLRFFV